MFKTLRFLNSVKEHISVEPIGCESESPEMEIPATITAPALPKLAYSPAEAAQVLGTCQDTIYRLLKRGKLRSSNALRHKLIPHFELERFLKSTLS